MDNIRSTIDTLFSQINSTAILKAFFAHHDGKEMLGVNEDMFCQKFMVENKCYTQDQVRVLNKNFINKYELSCQREEKPTCLSYPECRRKCRKSKIL